MTWLKRLAYLGLLCTLALALGCDNEEKKKKGGPPQQDSPPAGSGDENPAFSDDCGDSFAITSSKTYRLTEETNPFDEDDPFADDGGDFDNDSDAEEDEFLGDNDSDDLGGSSNGGCDDSDIRVGSDSPTDSGGDNDDGDGGFEKFFNPPKLKECHDQGVVYHRENEICLTSIKHKEEWCNRDGIKQKFGNDGAAAVEALDKSEGEKYKIDQCGEDSQYAYVYLFKQSVETKEDGRRVATGSIRTISNSPDTE